MKSGVELLTLSPAGSRQPRHAADLRPPFTRRQLDALPDTTGHIQTSSKLKPKEMQLVADWLAAHPKVGFRVWTAFGKSPYRDLEFLKALSEVTDLAIDLIDLKSFDGLRHLSPGLKSLSLGQTRSKAPSLEILAQFPKLQELSLDGHVKGIEVLSGLKALKILRLRRITLDDLQLLLPLKKLQEFSLHLGGTKDVSLLPQIGKLKQLELVFVVGLADLSCLAEMEHLQDLRLDSLKHVTSLPSLAELPKLKTVYIENLSQLQDLSPIAAAPALRDLSVYNMPQVEIENFRAFVGHPKLNSVFTVLGEGLRGKQRDQALKEILPFAKTWGDE